MGVAGHCAEPPWGDVSESLDLVDHGIGVRHPGSVVRGWAVGPPYDNFLVHFLCRDGVRRGGIGVCAMGSDPPAMSVV